MAETKVLAEETRRLEEAEKAKTNLATELAALCEQMEKARADAVAKFCISQPFFDACGIYYGDGFKDCLKQVRSAYPNLNLSQIVINDTVPMTPRGNDTVGDETINSIHTIEQEVEADGVVIDQPAPGGLDAVMVPSTENPTTVDSLLAVNPTVPDALPS